MYEDSMVSLAVSEDLTRTLIDIIPAVLRVLRLNAPNALKLSLYP